MALIDPPPLYGYTIFCDDIREEISGKATLVGVYRGFIFIDSAFPVALPKLCFHVWFLQKKELVREGATILIFLPGDNDENPSIKTEFPINKDSISAASEKSLTPKAEQHYLSLQANLVFSPFIIKEPGEIKIRVTHGDDLVRLGRLRVVRMTPEIKSTLGIQS